MERDSLKKEVKNKLKNLNKKQIVHFVWLCGMRALPFFCGFKFSFWKEEDKKKHIFSIFQALDLAASFADAASFDAAHAATAAAFNNTIKLDSIILQDLDNPERSSNTKYFNPSEFYGVFWDNFQKNLQSEECAYWGKLFEQIFCNDFALDLKALQRRLNVPEEIKKQGAAAVAIYLEALEKGATRLNEARIIILGDKGAGKTCLARRLINPEAPMTDDDESTAGVNTLPWKLEQENINVRIWDFAGHTVTHAVHQFFLSERCLYIMVYDGRTEERNRLEYWLNHMRSYGGESHAMILVNKRDRHSVDININTLKERYPIEGFYTFSIKSDKAKLEDFRKKVSTYIEDNPSWEKQEIPSSYYQVKEALEDYFTKDDKENGREHITIDEFNSIAERYNVENTEELLKDLHFLGVSLWYKHMEDFGTLVLNPEWISDGVYKIINWVNEKKRHSLDLKDFNLVFKDELGRYPEEKHEFLFRLMKHYELAYETNEKKCLIIPHLLGEDRPASLPEFPVGESLMLRYRAEQPLPPNTISRFIVRHNQEIKKDKRDFLVWRYGVILKDKKENIALVREEDRTISVAVKGKTKSDYISTLRETLNDLFNSYKNKKPELQYRIERFGLIADEVEEKNPLWLSDRKIFNHYRREKPYYDDFTNQNIPMVEPVTTYNIKAENLMMGGEGNQFFEDNSFHNTSFDFHDFNISLQGNINELAQLLSEGGATQEAKGLEIIAQALEQAEKCEGKEDVKKKGITNRLRRLIDDLENKGSRLHKTVKGIKNGISVAQDIAQGYNDLAQWVGLPQVPEPFLRKNK